MQLLLDMATFDSIEVHPVCHDEFGWSMVCAEENAEHWSLYLRYCHGGAVVCIGDIYNKSLAMLCADAIATKYGLKRGTDHDTG